MNCQFKKGPSCGKISTIPGNSKHEAVIGKDNDDEGEGLKLAAGNSISSVDSLATIPTVTHAEVGIRLDLEEVRLAIEVDDPPKLHGNTFACLAQNEEEGPSVEEGPLPVPIANIDFSDTSPIIDTFRHIKRVDELDFTPVPLSRKKLMEAWLRNGVRTH